MLLRCGTVSGDKRTSKDSSVANILVEYYKLNQLVDLQESHGALFRLSIGERAAQGVSDLFVLVSDLQKGFLSVTTPTVRNTPTVSIIATRLRVLEKSILSKCPQFEDLQVAGVVPQLTTAVREQIVATSYFAAVQRNLQDMRLPLTSALSSHHAARLKLRPMNSEAGTGTWRKS